MILACLVLDCQWMDPTCQIRECLILDQDNVEGVGQKEPNLTVMVVTMMLVVDKKEKKGLVAEEGPHPPTEETGKRPVVKPKTVLDDEKRHGPSPRREATIIAATKKDTTMILRDALPNEPNQELRRTVPLRLVGVLPIAPEAPAAW